MNSLPFLSHHLFVAAVGHQDRARRKARRRALSSAPPATGAPVAPVDVVDGAEALPEPSARPLRASALGGV